MNTYFYAYVDHRDDGDFYYVTENEYKPHLRESALSTLQIIEAILKYNISCEDRQLRSSHRELSHFGFAQLLKEKAVTIQEGFKEKTRTCTIIDRLLHCIFNRSIQKQEAEIDVLCTRIQNIPLPPAALPLLRDKGCTQKILSYLSYHDLAFFARLNRDANSHKNLALVARAQLAGYQENYIGPARRLLRSVFHVDEIAPCRAPRRIIAVETPQGFPRFNLGPRDNADYFATAVAHFIRHTFRCSRYQINITY